jgi:hypothetical protein
MASKRPKPKAKLDPVRPGDDVIAHEEIEAYYRSRVEKAAAELERAQAEFERVSAGSAGKLEAFHVSGNLDLRDVPWIEMNAGGRSIASDAVFREITDPATTPERKREIAELHDLAKARHAATTRWLRDQGYSTADSGD